MPCSRVYSAQYPSADELALPVRRHRRDLVGLGRRQQFGVAIQPAAGRGVDDPPDARLPRGFEHRDRAEHIDRSVERRIADGNADVDLRAEVEHDLGPDLLEHRLDPRRVADIDDLEVRPGAVAASRFSRLPVERLSSTVTWSPRASSPSTRFEPMNPAPPVTIDRMRPTVRDRPIE